MWYDKLARRKFRAGGRRSRFPGRTRRRRRAERARASGGESAVSGVPARRAKARAGDARTRSAKPGPLAEAANERKRGRRRQSRNPADGPFLRCPPSRARPGHFTRRDDRAAPVRPGVRSERYTPPLGRERSRRGGRAANAPGPFRRKNARPARARAEASVPAPREREFRAPTCGGRPRGDPGRPFQTRSRATARENSR